MWIFLSRQKQYIINQLVTLYKSDTCSPAVYTWTLHWSCRLVSSVTVTVMSLGGTPIKLLLMVRVSGLYVTVGEVSILSLLTTSAGFKVKVRTSSSITYSVLADGHVTLGGSSSKMIWKISLQILLKELYIFGETDAV